MKAPVSHAPGRADINRTWTGALTFPRSMRRVNARCLTSLPAGKSVPLMAVGLLREDAVRSGRLRFNFEMMETAEIIMNPINVRVMAYLVPTLAFERFQGSMDILNKSYKGEAPMEGETPIPFIETAAYGTHGANEVYKYLGIHGQSAQLMNTAYLEAYNLIQNFRRKNRSPKLSMRTRLQTSLAEAFWYHEQFKHIVPSFDQSGLDGDVPLSGDLPVRGIGILAAGATVEPLAGPANVRDTARGAVSVPYGPASFTDEESGLVVQMSDTDSTVAIPEIYAELRAEGVTLTLANIELARKTQAFSQLRKRYTGHSDEWIIDLLMQGITIPEQAFKQPILVGERATIVGMAKRYATDSGNLAESAVNGATFVDLSVRVPRVPMGGVLMVIAEITPEQLFERQADPYLACSAVADFPDALRDELDPIKVMTVQNGRIDVHHSEAAATFGYAPNNYMWNVTVPRVGGKFLRPVTNTEFDEDRQRLWSAETVDPSLAEDFYLCTALHQKPFAVTTGDTFECVTIGDVFIEGNTQFGTPLLEAGSDYEAVMGKAPTDVPEQPEEEE